MKRATIIAKGEVQGVGYRGVVFKIARKLNITGFVENIKPYDVRIIGEGEKENFDNFVEQIKIEEHPILVEEVDVTFEEPTGEFEYFEVKRGDITEELCERLDLFRTETQQNFATLDTKYSKVAENMERILEEMKEERKESRESMEKILNAILKLVEKSGR